MPCYIRIDETKVRRMGRSFDVSLLEGRGMLGRRKDPALNEPLARRNVYWASVVTHLMIENEDLRRQIPNGAHIIVLPIEDPELYRHNLSLRSRLAEGTPVVLVEVKVEDATVCVQPLQSMAARRVAAPQLAYA